MHRGAQLRSRFAEVFERPAFIVTTGKGMNDREVFSGRLRDDNSRDPFRGRWKRGEKRERKMAHGIAKLRTMGPVPGIDGVERFELRDASVFPYSHQIQTRVDDGAGTIVQRGGREEKG
jgi:hypothetical protein